MRSAILFSAAVLLISAVTAALPQSTQNTGNLEVSAEEYEIYSALIQQYYVQEKVPISPMKKVKLLFIVRRTAAFRLEERYGRVPSFVTSVQELAPSEVVSDFNARNQSTTSFEDGFHASFKYVLIDESEERKLAQQMNDDPPAWEKRYPKCPGILTLTRIGFSSDRTKALVGLHHYCGNVCADEIFGLLVKDQGLWKFQRWSSVRIVS